MPLTNNMIIATHQMGFSMLEPDEVKVSCPVLRGEKERNLLTYPTGKVQYITPENNEKITGAYKAKIAERYDVRAREISDERAEADLPALTSMYAVIKYDLEGKNDTEPI